MRRIGLRPAAAAVALLLSACGSNAAAPTKGGSRSLSVDPAAPSPSSEITFRFTPPESAGVHGQQQLSYGLTVSGPHRTGCVSTHEAAPGRAVRGEVSRVVIGPAQLGGTWCVGTYAARVQEFARPVCKPEQPCPMYVRVVGSVGTATFTVRSD